ncbi:MAG: hypothetical protein ABIA63_02850, partial [bacterium]
MKKNNKKLILNLLIISWLAVPASTAGDSDSISGTFARGPSFARVYIYLKRDLEKSSIEKGDLYKNYNFESYIDEEKPFIMPCIAVPGEEQFLAPDIWIPENMLERIEIADIKNQTSAAEIHARFKNIPAIILRPADKEGWGHLSFRPVKFRDTSKLEELSDLYMMYLKERDGEWEIQNFRMPSAYAYDKPSRGLPHFLTYASINHSNGLGFGPVLITDTLYNPLGISFTQSVQLDSACVPWTGKELAGCEIFNAEDMAKAKREFSKICKNSFYKVILRFRAQPLSSSDYHAPYSYNLDEGPGHKEKIFFGMAVDDSRLFIPHELSREMAKRVEEILIENEKGFSKGEFYGAFKKFGGFIIKVNDMRFEPVKADTNIDLPAIFEIFFSASVEFRYGARDAQIDLNRFLSFIRGRGNRKNIIAGGPLIQGDFLFNQSGKLAGLYLKEKKADEEQIRILKKHYGESYSSLESNRVFSLREAQGIFSGGVEGFDSSIAVMTKEQQKRRLWLGIEYNIMNPNLAQVMNLEKQTKNGKMGLIISKVYDGSPADKSGLRIGDILLFIKEPGKELLELIMERSYESYYSSQVYFNISG